MRKIAPVLAGLVLLLTSAPAFTCSFDTDCRPGSRCMKPSGSIYGYCMGGMSPGNSYDRRPARNPLDLTGKQGNTCRSSFDCGIGGTCVKGAGSLRGTCL